MPTSQNNQIPLFDGVAETTMKRASLTGVPKLASGVMSATAATINDLGSQTADYSANTHKITNLTDPSSAQDAATKAYVDAVAQGLSVKPSAVAATVAALPTNVYANGSSGVGATITGVSTGVLTVDGHAVAVNEYILVKDETAGNAPNNGLYKCTIAGAVGVAFVLTRAVEMDVAAEYPGAFVFVETGTVNASAGFVCTNATAPTVGTTNISFQQFSGAGEITAGTNLSKSGNTLSLVSAPTISDFTNMAHDHGDADDGGALAVSILTLTTSTARTATSDGTGTGTIADGTDFVPVTCDDANKIIILPTPTPKTVVALRNGATGYELRSSSPTTVAINGGTGSAAESAIPANTLTICLCDTATTWICSNTNTAGVTSPTEVAAP